MEKRCPTAARPAASALLEQAQDFYRAANAGVQAAKPLLLYYCFMNLVKAFILTVGRRDQVGEAQHGLSEKLDDPPNNRELINAFLAAFQTLPAGPVPPDEKLNLFDELLIAIQGTGLPAPPARPAPQHFRIDVKYLLPQVVPGHRLWASVGGGTAARERFVAIERIEFVEDAAAQNVWLRMFVVGDDLRRLNLGHQAAISRSLLDGTFREVHTDEFVNHRKLVCLEQGNVVHYNHRPSDVIPQVVAAVRHRLWRTILIMPPYRRYYLYTGPVAEHGQVFPQVVSIYAITYYLGSIVRYRPHQLRRNPAGRVWALYRSLP